MFCQFSFALTIVSLDSFEIIRNMIPPSISINKNEKKEQPNRLFFSVAVKLLSIRIFSFTYFPEMLEPSIRIELMTSSLPFLRHVFPYVTCSAMTCSTVAFAGFMFSACVLKPFSFSA
jgi:hypothetical protein